MEVRGNAINLITDYVKSQQGADGFQLWLNALPSRTIDVMTRALQSNDWFPAEDGFIAPIDAVCRVFFQGAPRGAWEIGRYCAHHHLASVTAKITGFSSFQFMVHRFLRFYEAIYRPGAVKLIDEEQNRFLVRIVDLDQSHPYLEQRLAGWIEAGLEMCQLQNVKVTINRSASAGAGETEIEATWVSNP